MTREPSVLRSVGQEIVTKPVVHGTSRGADEEGASPETFILLINVVIYMPKSKYRNA